MASVVTIHESIYSSQIFIPELENKIKNYQLEISSLKETESEKTKTQQSLDSSIAEKEQNIEWCLSELQRAKGEREVIQQKYANIEKDYTVF